MNNQHSKLMYLGVIAVLVVGFVWLPISAAEKPHDRAEHPAKVQAAGEKNSHASSKSQCQDSHKSQCQDSHKSQCQDSRKLCVKTLEEVIRAIDAAKKAIDAGDKAKALEQLAKARKLVATSHKAMLAATHKAASATGAIANTRCPIMGSKLDPSKVPANLTRVYEGKKIGFCCGGCPAKWDKLSETQRKEKLMKAAPAESHKPKQPAMEHDHKKHGK